MTRVPGWLFALHTTWMTWALLAPVVAGAPPLPPPVHNCPNLMTRHIVACPPPHTLKPGQQPRCLRIERVDLCAERHHP